MSSPFSLRHLAASRLLRVMALFGWLLMAISLPTAGAMAGEAQHDRGDAVMASMTMDQAVHAHAMTTDGHHADDCCGGDSHSACHCDAMCGSVMLPSVAALYGPLALGHVHVSMRTVDAPTPQLIPPLRPPAV